MKRLTTACAALLAAAAGASAQSNISDDHKFAWQENTGWSNWHDAGESPGSDGVVVFPNHLAGWMWLENAGWVSLGQQPGDGGPYYANTSGETAGVNILDSGAFDGFAWNENTGWINFGTSMILGQAGARFDRSSCRLRGYAWGENIGWLNLDHVNTYIGIYCYADCDDNCQLNINDFVCFTDKFAGGDSYANCDGSVVPPVLNINDYMCFMTRFAQGCPQ